MRNCVLCGREYNYCPNCAKDRSKPTWHKLFDNENCKDIFNILNDYTFELSTKEEAKELLSKCDIAIELNDHYRNEINAIMAEPKKTKQVKKVEEVEEVKEEPKVEIEPEVEF